VLDRRFVAGEHDRVRPRVLLLDIDGVLYVEDEPVLGAVASVRWLRAAGRSLDVGPFVAGLEYATGQEATVVGKPASAFFELALADAGAAAADAVMVGDDVESDIGGALSAGLAGILVRTGKYREDVVMASGVEPSATVDSIAEVPTLVGA
jgi:ribonucleotide monophosphatase NagD (HAD superfamily)